MTRQRFEQLVAEALQLIPKRFRDEMHNVAVVVEDEPLLMELFTQSLTLQGYEVSAAADGEGALQLLTDNAYDLVLTDLYLPKADGFQILAYLQRFHPSSSAIVITGYGSIQSAVEAMKQGAFDYITKPVSFDQLALVIKKALEVQRLQQENRLLREQLKRQYRFDHLIGTSGPMQQVFQLIEKVAEAESTVLICGESGTGKELVARAIHFNSHRGDKSLIPVNCGAIPESLLESELFGHERGAFTGAIRTRLGRFELAHGGTIFLDEVGDMSPALQVKLLRVLQEQSFERVGGTKSIRVDVRILAATNRDLEQAVAQGAFREDLYYRLSVIPLHLPPLRARKDDIPLLFQHFVDHFNQMRHRQLQGLSPLALEVLLQYGWPGNVRELENLADRLVVLKGQGVIEPEDLPEKMRVSWRPSSPLPTVDLFQAGFCLDDAMRAYERVLLTTALQRTDGIKSKAAQLLGIKRTTLIEKLKRYSLPPDQ